MDNPEEVLHSLDEFAKLKPKNIPRELEDYLMYVARTGDPVYQWPTVKSLFREKLLNVISEFYETTPTLDVTPSPNVDPFNYESMKTVLLERLEAFSNAPFTVQRLCELLTTPRKEYNRPDKFMRAIEKNILVVSTREPGGACRPDSALSEPIANGVSDPPEAASNQSGSSNREASNEESTAQTSSEATPKEPEENHESHENHENNENHVTMDTTSEAGSNHIESEPAESTVKISEEAEVNKEEEASESAVKDSDESPEATDSSDSVTFGEVNNAADNLETANVTSTDSVSNSKVSNLAEQATVCEAETSAVESVPMLSSSSEISSAVNEVSNTVQDEVTSEAEKENVVSESESKETESVVCEASVNEDEVTSEAASEPSESVNETSKPMESSANEVEEGESSNTEPAVSSPEQDQPADSTGSDAIEEKETPSADAVSSGSSNEVSSEVVTESKSEKDVELDTAGTLAVAETAADLIESSEAAPVVEKEVEAKKNVETVKSDVDASITSTEGIEGTGVDVEAMDVDEGSNQQSEASAADSEAMEVADEDEPMDVCEDSALEAMTSSPQESTQ